jgi:hypothetical protein
LELLQEIFNCAKIVTTLQTLLYFIMKNAFNSIGKAAAIIGLSTLASCSQEVPKGITTQEKINQLTFERDQRQDPIQKKEIQSQIESHVEIRELRKKQNEAFRESCKDPKNPDYKFGGENVKGQTCIEVSNKSFEENK